MSDRTGFILICCGALIVFVSMSLFYSFYGRVFLDAGFYLNAAREVYQGQMLYRDFFYVQGPVYPYIYGLPLHFTGYNVLYARWISLVFGVMALLLAAWTAKRSGGSNGFLIALLILATVPSHAYYFTSVKLYALSGFLIMATFAALISKMPLTWRHTLGLVLAILAAGARLTLIPAVFVIAVYVIRDSYKVRNKFPVIAVGCAIITGLSLSAPFLLMDSESVLYYLIGIHTSAAEGPYVHTLPARIKVLAAIAVTYPLLTVFSLFALFKCLKKKYRFDVHSLELTMAVSILLVTIAHLTANWFSVGYQSLLMPLTAALIGGLSGRWLRLEQLPRILYAGLLLLIIGSGLLNWKKHVWINEPMLSVTSYLDEIGQVIDQYVSQTGSIAGCTAIFALHADRPVAGAFGGAPFTYTPKWTDEQCLRFGGVNNSILYDMMRDQTAEALFFEPDSFAIGFPGFYPVSEELQEEAFRAINKYYRHTETLRSLGDGVYKLKMYIPETDEIFNGSE